MRAPSKAVREPSSKFARFLRLSFHLIASYYLMQRRTHAKQRRAECPVNVLQVYTRQSKTIMSKSFENFRRHFLKINFRYNVRFLTSTATYIVKMEAAIAVTLVSGTKNVVCLLQDSVLMMVAVCYTETLERQLPIG